MFTVDMAFVGTQPEGLRRGQSSTVELTFGEAKQSLMVKKKVVFTNKPEAVGCIYCQPMAVLPDERTFD